MVEEKTGLDIDDWLDDLSNEKSTPPTEEMSGEMNQSDIDSLFGGEAADNKPASTLNAPQEKADGSGPVTVTAEANEDFAELDQADINSLLGGDDKEPPVMQEAAADSDFILDQSDIDGLFTDSDSEQLDKPTNFTEDTQDWSKTTQIAASEENSFGLPKDSGFDDDEFDFGDLPDIPDEINTENTAPQTGGNEEDIFGASASDTTPNFLEEAPMDNNRVKPSLVKEGEPPFIPHPKAWIKKAAAAVGLSLILLGVGGYFFVNNQPGVAPVPVPPPVQEKPAAVEAIPPVTVAPIVPAKAPPVANESRWRMTQPNESLAIELSGTDEKNDPLKFEIVTQPKFGRISGNLPTITYLPNKDFPGEDSFSFTVSDGQLISAPAIVTIMGPEEVKPAETAEAPKEEPVVRPVVIAKNIRLQTMSTDPLVINWKKIWSAANQGPFSAKVSVEILDGLPMRGSLRPLDRIRYLYEPNRYFGGKEVVRYRFKADGIFSRIRELVIVVKPNDKPPIVVLRPVADSYKVGERVVLDASLTRDDSPGGVRYSWEQLAGAPVFLEKLQGEGSAVSFVVPSSFKGEYKIQIVVRVTATDSGDQRTSKEIRITPVSKRQTALWGIGGN